MEFIKLAHVRKSLFLTLMICVTSGMMLPAVARPAPPPPGVGQRTGVDSGVPAPPSDIPEEAAGIQPVVNDRQAGEKRAPVIMAGKKTLPMRLLTRPFSNLYDKPAEGARPVAENVPTFSILYAYSTPGENPGWYEVGPDNRGNVKGWMKARDVIEWKQFLTMSFTNPAERSQTLFFRDKENLLKLVGDSGRAEGVQALRRTIDEVVKDPQQKLPSDFAVVAREPADFASLHLRPYLMPVLQFEQVDLDGRETRVLEITTTVKGSARATEKAKVRDEDFAPAGGVSDADVIRDWKADVVFVIDATASMQPYIEGTRQVVRDSARKIEESRIGGKISYGMVAYRDNVALVPGIEYTSKIFCNLEEGTDINTFNQKVSSLQDAKVGSQGFDEDVWAGIMTALNHPALKARPDASLFIIHIGDAAAHDPPDPMGTTGLNAPMVRRVADDRRPHPAVIASLHLLSPDAMKTGNVSKAAAQFRTIASKNPKSTRELYFPVDNADPELFRQQADEVVATFIAALKESAQGKVPGLNPGSPPPAPSAPGGSSASAPPNIAEELKGAILAAQLEWLGSRKTEKGDVKVPTDIQAWVVDRDLEAPGRNPMDVRLLITKNNIDQLKKSLDRVLEAGTKSSVTGADFFDEMQSAVATDIRGTGKQSLGKIGLLPEFIEGLPYKSEILEMTNDEWTSMSADNQAEFLNKVQAKIKLYENYYADQSKWIELNSGDEPGDHVMFLDLNALP